MTPIQTRCLLAGFLSLLLVLPRDGFAFQGPGSASASTLSLPSKPGSVAGLVDNPVGAGP